MKQKIILLCLCLVCTGRSTYAQWVVSDPTNLAQGIVNSTKQVVEAAKNGQTMLQSFQETVKIYEQGKRYYDALKSVSNLVRSARKVQQCILLVGEISDIYVDGYRRMVGDENFTPVELAAIAAGYARIIEESAGELKELQDIVNPYGYVPDGQGPDRRGAARLRRSAAPSRPGTLLHAQEHLHIPAAGRPETGHGGRALIVRNRRTTLLVVWYACFPSRRTCIRFSGCYTTI